MYDDNVRESSALQRVLAVLWRRRWLGIGVAVAVLAAALTLTLALPNVYESTATVLVESPHVSEDLVKPAVTTAVETRLRSINEEIVSRARLTELITTFGLYPQMRHRVSEEDVIQQMKRDIHLDLKSVDRKRTGELNTIAFTVSYRGETAATVADVANTLVSSYIDENQRVRARQARETSAFLASQVPGAIERVREQENKLIEFKRQHIGELPEQMGSNLAALEQLHAQLRTNASNQIRATERRDARMEHLAEGQSAGAAKSGKSQLARLKRQLAELRSQYTERHPDVVRVRAEIAQLEAMGGEAIEDDDPAIVMRREAVSDAQAEFRALKAEEQRLRRSIADYERRVTQAPALEQELQALAREYEGAKEMLKSLQTRSAEAQMAVGMEQRRTDEEFRVIEPAIAAATPVAPSRPRLALLGAVAALALGGLAVVVHERLDGSFHRVEEVRAHTSLPVVARIPVIPSGGFTRRLGDRLALATAFALAVVLLGTGSYYVARDNQALVTLLERR